MLLKHLMSTCYLCPVQNYLCSIQKIMTFYCYYNVTLFICCKLIYKHKLQTCIDYAIHDIYTSFTFKETYIYYIYLYMYKLQLQILSSLEFDIYSVSIIISKLHICIVHSFPKFSCLAS